MIKNNKIKLKFRMTSKNNSKNIIPRKIKYMIQDNFTIEGKNGKIING